MPLFVLISGFFTNLDSSKYWKGVLNLFLTFGFYQFICLFVQFLWGGQFSLEILITPYWTLWYLFSLVCWRIIAYLFRNIMVKYLSILLLSSFVLAFFSCLIPNGRVLSIARTMHFLPFFLYGYYIRIGALDKKIISRWLSAFVVFLCLFVSILFSRDSYLLNIERGAISDYGIYGVMNNIWIIPFSLIVSLAVWSIIGKNNYLADIGNNSLVFYIYHTLILQFVCLPLLHHFNISHDILSIMAIWCVLIILLYLWSKCRLSSYLLNPFANAKFLI